MFSSIKTSKENKEIITQLTKKLSLGAENIIARIAFAYSLASERKLDIAAPEDSQGKEYSYKVLFGEHGTLYVAMLCVHYNLHKSDRDIAKYVKMHVDDGLRLLNNEVENLKNSVVGTDFIIRKVEAGLR